MSVIVIRYFLTCIKHAHTVKFYKIKKVFNALYFQYVMSRLTISPKGMEIAIDCCGKVWNI